MFERFTDRARRVVVLAQEEARMLNHNYIGTEHILLGLIHEGEGVAAKALESLGISLDAVREQVQEIIGQGQQAPSGHIPFTPRAKKVLELSLREALQLGHNYIGTEHILLGLIREGEGVAAQVLVKLGADLNRVRQQVIQLLTVPVQVGAELDKHLGGNTLTLADQAKQDVLGPDVVVAELQRLAQAQLEDLLGTRGEGDVTGRGLLTLTDNLLDLLAHRIQGDTKVLQRLCRDAFTLVDQAEQDVLGPYVVVVEHARFLLRKHDHPAGSVSKPFEHRSLLLAIEIPRCYLCAAAITYVSRRPMHDGNNDAVCWSVPSHEPPRLMFALGVSGRHPPMSVGHRWKGSTTVGTGTSLGRRSRTCPTGIG